MRTFVSYTVTDNVALIGDRPQVIGWLERRIKNSTAVDLTTDADQWIERVDRSLKTKFGPQYEARIMNAALLPADEWDDELILVVDVKTTGTHSTRVH
ncbi:hypothetical protein [Ralstonia phage phiRSL1]|uniref:Uncharacterized protein n=1 Tax=Ralstonia phage phiRSL1 TaxID=1980924 RepID=B2ZY58_9CAUD|nr:hypothetical protein RSL1_ORF178 [Ralstonia phage phiRSL1]BAG41626.1 hypothetical protein [Ralstonia phage phiRSL1]